MSRKKKNAGPPPLRVFILPIGTGAMLGALFGVALNSWVSGLIAGLVITGVFGAFLFFARKGALSKLR
ncbi:MAG: hypothetical protein AAFX09_06505 [Pseudomonadota bacterium]